MKKILISFCAISSVLAGLAADQYFYWKASTTNAFDFARISSVSSSAEYLPLYNGDTTLPVVNVTKATYDEANLGVYANLGETPIAPYTVQFILDNEVIASASISNITGYVTSSLLSPLATPFHIGFDGNVEPETPQETGVWYVSASSGSDDNAGTAGGVSLKTLSAAVGKAKDGDTIFVGSGVYPPISTDGKNVVIVGMEGAGKTFIDGSLTWDSGITNRCATLGSTTNAVLRGFTLVNGIAPDDNYYGGGAYYGTLEDCVISNCTARYGGGTYYSSLKRCIVKNNTATWLGGGTYYGSTESTLIAENTTTNRCGGTYYGTHVNSTITANTAGIAPGGCFGGTIRNTISYANTASSGSSNYYNVTNTTCYYSCVSPSQSGNGNINSNPKFVDPASGDYSLQNSSPCVNTGWNYLSVDALDAMCNVRTRGSRTDMGAYELQQGSVYDGNRTLYVSGAIGTDSNDGLSWETSFKTIQAAINAAMPGDSIVVTNGTYGTINSEGKALRIESVEGAEATIIDGNNSTRCATLGSSSSDKATVLVGFTLYRGRASSADGGGALYGTLEDSIISNCQAYQYNTYRYGGGTYYTDAKRCVYTSNRAEPGYGGGAYYGTLVDCQFLNNRAYYGGGTYYGTISNCVYSGNSATSYNGGGAYYGTLYDCEVKDNTASQYGGGIYGSALYRCLVAGNRASSYYGGGAYSGTLYECVISNNTASTYGGGVNGSTMYNCLVVKNSTTGSSSSGGGVQGGTAYNCTICDNSAPYRGGMQGGSAYNCIIWGNTETRQTSNYANVSNTTCRATCTSPLQTNHENNISEDPLFVDRTGGDYRLTPDSPCVDTGLNSFYLRAADIDGNYRVSNRRVDMGAYELQQSASTDGVQTTWYVNGAVGDDDADGLTDASPFKTIDAAALGAAPGDKIIVAPGVYPPIRTFAMPVRIESTGGAANTIIDASLGWADGVTNRCATLYEGYGTVSNTSLVGFTLVNGISSGSSYSSAYGGGTYGGTLIDCVVSNCTSTTGGGCYNSFLFGCRIIGNTATNGGGAANCQVIDRSLISGNYAQNNGGGTYGGSRVANSIIADNEAGNWGGGMHYAQELFNCTITANKAAKGGGIYARNYPRAYNSIIWGNTLPDGVTTDNWVARYPRAYFYNCCTTPIVVEGGRTYGADTCIDTDPFLCRFSDGTYRIPATSLCVDAGDIEWIYSYGSYYDVEPDSDYFGNAREQGAAVDMGAIEGGFAGVVVSTRCEGLGKISDSVACNSGETVVVEVSAHDSIHEFAGIFVNGEDATENATLTDGIYRLSITPTANTTVVARFLPTTIYVSPSGDDSATGGSWDAAKQTIQGAIDASSVNDTIIVTNGTYGAIRMVQNYPLLIQSVEGRDATVIDGEDSARCAHLGSDTTSTNVVLVGFTLANGNAGSSYGGGAYYGTLRDCRITNCHAYNYGGGAYYANLERCIIEGNSSDNGYGGGTYYGTIDNCLIVNNYARNGGGGTYYGSLYNCTIVNNSTSGTGNNPGGSYYGAAYNTIIWGNTGGYGNYYGTSLYASNASDDPQFTSIDGNSWALTMSSPCLDAGTNSYVRSETDLSGNVRIQNGTVDLGCYETTPLEGVPLTSVIVASGTYTYRGTEWCPTVTVRAGDGTLRESEHYTLEWLDNIDAGTARVVAHAIAPTFAGSVTNTFTIVPKTLTTSMFTLSAAYPFTGEEVRPEVTITESSLTAEDWDVSYANNIAPGTATVTLTGKRNYTGTASRTFAVSCAELYVSTSGDDGEFGVSADAPKRSLQAAVTAAYDGAVIYVDDGVYQPVTTSNKPIEIRSINGHDKAIIDGGGTNRCVYAGDGGGNNQTIFYGFTIRNGRLNNNGYGAGARGGTFYNCVFENNVQSGSSYAGGATSGSNLYNCLLVGNSGYNGGGANAGVLVNCTVVGNTASNYGGGVYNGVTLRNSIVWGNYSPNSYSNYNGCTFTYSCTMPSVSGTGNISANPYFADTVGGDYRLQQYSPCLDVGNNSYVVGETDLTGTNRVIDATVDMGAYEGWVYLPTPVAVEGLSAEDGTRIGLVRLTWTGVEYARNYSVHRSATESFDEYEVIGTTGSSFFDDETATPESTYWYRVVGVNPAGEGPASAADSGWCLGEMTFGSSELPTAVAGLAYNTKLGISGGSGNYVWKTGADDYDVVYGESTYLVSDHVSSGVSGDDNCLSYPLPFDFPFYGKSYNKVWVNSNGTINFDGSYNGYSADEATFKSKAMIAVLWKDLRTGSGGVGVSTNGNESITFLWNGASYYSGGAAVNVSVTLYSDGTILCSYGNGNASGGFVGVSAGDGTHYRNLGLNGISLANADDIRFVPQDVPGGLTLASDGTLSGTASVPGTYTFTVFVTDSYGNGATQKVTLEVEENPNMRTVQFDLGEYGVRGGGGDLLQYVLLGGDATPPTVRAKTGWLFDGWTGTFTNIADSVVVTANYRSTFADLEVSSIEIPSDVMSGNNVEIRWTVANTGNPQFSGTMTEKVTLVSVADENVTIDVASPSFNGTIARNGSVERSATVAVPLKGWVGTWKVRVETAIRPSVREFAENNVTVSTSTFEITAAPLPDLSAKSIALDLDPAEYMPLDTVTVRYVVQNTGTGATTAPWRDRLYLCKNGAKATLATVDISDDIAAGAEVERTIQCVIPELVALSGDVAFVVNVDCDDSIVELADDDSNENATWEATPNATLGKRIYLAFNSASVYENSGSVRFYAKRSGETDKALILSLSAAGATSDVTFPAEITIGAGSSTASGYVYPIDNNVVEGARNVVFTLTPPVGADFDAVTSTLTILDNEVPKLTMSFDKVSVKEGDAAIIVTVTRELVTDQPLTVYLNGVSTSHCSYPSSVVIPAGEASVTFELAAVDNDAAEIAAALTLRASANGYTAATQSFSVEDDDVPSVTLTIYPEELSEGAGPNAAYAILSRVNEDNIGSAITVNLTPSIPNQLILQSSVTIPAYTMAVRFQFGPVDNGDDEGDRDITITGSIYIPSCGCSSQPSSGDVIEATIRIIDNDTPALSLTADPSTMKEGLDHAGDLILSHNSVLTEDLVVTLSFDTEGEIEIPASVVIPAGETSVTIPVKTIDDGETDGGKLVSVYADDESGAFKSASTWIQVSDQNLPDLKVMAITRPSSVYAGKKFDIEFETANVGFVAAPNEIEYAIHLVGGNRGSSATSSNKIYSGKITGGIVVNDSIVTSYTVTAPSDTGDYRIVVVLDPDGKISELDDANNSLTSDAIAVSAAYTATVTVAEKVYLPGDEIVFNGVATMPDGTTPAANLPIDLYVLVNGMRRTYHLTADSNGAFGMTFEPSSGEAGRYTIGACYPGVASTVAQDYFDILGMKRSSTSNIIWDYALGDVATRTVYIQNRSGTPLTGLTATFAGIPEECDLQYTLPDTIPANGSVALTMTATAVGVTEQVDYSKFTVHLEVAEGLTLDFPLYFHSQTQKAYLRANPSSINTTMAIGHTRYIDVTISNDGKGDSGKITLSLPDVRWLRIISGTTIDNLASGESATVTLEVAPEESHNLVLNNPLRGGRFTANCENGTGVSIPLTFTPVSDNAGSVFVDTLDNNTYVLESGPHLSNAVVRITNPYTGALVLSGTTGQNGTWEASGIPEGRYQLSITAANHDSYADELIIEPGKTSNVEAFLQYQIVTATWNVERTEIEDSYEVTLLLDFETSVPAPVVNTIMPTDFPTLNEGESWSFTVTLQNTGVIAAERVTVIMPEIEGYTFTLSDNDVAVPAKSSVEISGVFSRPKTSLQTSNRLAATSVMVVTTVSCTYRSRTIVVYPCGKEHPEYSYEKIIRHGECEVSTSVYISSDDNWNPGNGGNGGNGGDPSRIIGPGGGIYGPGGFSVGPGSTYTKKDSCNVCYTALKDALRNCSSGFEVASEVADDFADRYGWGNDNFNRVPWIVKKLPDADPDYATRILAGPMEDVYRKNGAEIDLYGYKRLSKSETEKYVDGTATVDSTGSIRGTVWDGFKAAIYESSDGDEIVLSFAGTDGLSALNDWWTNLRNGTCFNTSQYDRAARLLKQVVEKNPGKKVTVVGHSLGGGLTEYAILKNNFGGRVKGVTYNSAGICKAMLPTDVDYDAAAQSVTNYRTPNDYVSDIGSHIGPVYNIEGDGHIDFGYLKPNPKTGKPWYSNSIPIQITKIIGALSNLVDTGEGIGASIGARLFGVGNCISQIYSACDGAKFGDFVEAINMLRDEAQARNSFNTGNVSIDAELTHVSTLTISYATYLNSIVNIFYGAATANEMTARLSVQYGRDSSSYSRKTSLLGVGELSGEWLDASPQEIISLLEEMMMVVLADDELTVESVIQKKPVAVSVESLAVFIDRLKLTNPLADDYLAHDADGIDLVALEENNVIIGNAARYAIANHFESLGAMWRESIDKMRMILDNESSSVCASVTLQLSQSVSMTREAFNGTLTMYNGNTQTPITALKMDVSITDEEGNECKDMFVTNDLGNSGATSGGYILDGGLTVAAGGTGSSVIQFIPERRAAETEPKLYKFGGTITYIDPFSGESATIKLTPVALTVNPSPYLKLHYFIQRDVYGDDPNTETVEASMPAEMALLVVNEGVGNANNVTIASVQPSVVKNEKGLSAEFSMKDYSLEKTALNGATAHLGLNTVTLGTIPAGESQVAQWWLTSSIDGHFTDMAATVTPVNSWNTPDTMLVNPDIGKHLLIRSLSVEGETKPHFLVSEGADLYGTPNAIYSSDGSSEQVHNDATMVVNGQLVGSDPELSVAVTAGSDGWNYGNVRLDGVFRYRVVSVVRSDNTEVSIRNVWITNKIFRDGLDPVLEERLHIIDEFATVGTQTYTITLEAKPSDVPEVDAFNVENGQIEYVARNSIEVQFSKAINASTFTLDDVVLRKQGVLVDDISSLSIAASDAAGTRFTISGLAALCGDLGRYELVVQCAGIYDLSGQLGISGKSVAWTLSTPDSPYILDAEGRPTKRVRRMDGVTTVTSVPVTEESAQNLVVTLNGTDVSQFVTISPSDDTGTRFSIEGLDDLQLNDGDYTLVIDCANLVGVDGGSGIDSYTVTWTRDTTAPVVNGVSRETGLNGTSFILDLTEDADPETISLDNVMLTRKTSQKLNLARGLLGVAPAGETEIALPASARLVANGEGQYTLTGLDSVILADGTYTLYFDASGVADEAGNEASGVKSVSWTVDTTAPDEVTDIAVSSEYGSVDACVYTATRELTISGTVPESGLTVEVYAKYVGSAETLLAEPEVDGDLRFTADVTLPGDGNLTIIIRLTDEYGNSSDTEFAVYVDAIALGAEISGMPEPDVAADALTITFLNGTPVEASALAATMSLTKDGVAVDIPNVTIARTEDRIYTVSGLANYTAEYGTYVFSYDVREVAKVTSGMTGAAVATAEWVNYPLDTTAPTIADIRFNGAVPAVAYVTDQMFTEVSVRFSEAVNVPALVEQGIAGQAFSIQFLSDDNEIVGTLPAEDVAWNATTFTASWTIDGSAVPCGKARLVVDASLVKDESGNGLATTEAYDIISGAKTYTPSVLKRGVAYSYACPELYDWNNDGLLDLIVGEKTENGKGKVRIYLNRGTAAQPEFDDYTYLQKSGEDVEFTGAGCVGMQVSFGHLRRATMVLATSQGEIYGWRHRSRDPKTKDSVEWESWFDHSTDARFAGLQRTQTFCCDIDGDGYDEVIVSGQNSPMFWLKRTLNNGEYATECTPLMDADGANLQYPAGQNHTAAIMTDVSGDAVLDLVTGDTAGNVWVYYGTGNARFSATPVMIYENTETSNKRSRLALGDINGDGVEDILVGRQDGSVLLFKGEAVLSPAVNFKCVEIKSVEEALNDYIYWVDGADGWTCEQFGEEAQATVTHTGDAQTTVLSAKFTGMGTVTFTWAVSGANESSEFRCTGGDSEIVKNGPFNQLAQSVTISTPGEHVVNWVFTGRNTAIVRDVAFTPADESLQVTQTTVVPVAFSDINRLANEIWKANGGDYEAAAKATAANGKTVLDNCVAGLDSSDPNATFKAKITYEDGKAKISWIPALNGEVDNEGVPTGIRTYTVYGTDSLENDNWQLVTPENKPSMRFFKVKVQMP